MNICFVSREYPSDYHQGGIGTYTEKTARALADLGQSVHVITEAWNPVPPRLENGVTVIRLAVPRIRPDEVRLTARARAVASAVARLPRAPDIVQVCEWRAEGFWYALRDHPRTRLITRLATPGFLVDQFDSQSHDAERRPRLTKARIRVVDWLERLQTIRSDGIISPTEALADIVCGQWRISRERVAIMHTGVDFAERFAASAVELPEVLRDQEYLLYFGRLEERKGVHILAQALPGILAAYPRLRVVFAGEDYPYDGQSMRTFIESCNQAYRNRLLFFPRLPQRELYPLLQHALIAVLPSLWENLANTCLEALDMGVPVVATLGCGFSEVIDDGRSGLLVPPGDVPALARALHDLLRDRHRLSHMARAAKASADRFALPVVTERLLRFYETLHDAPALSRRRKSSVLRDTGLKKRQG